LFSVATQMRNVFSDNWKYAFLVQNYVSKVVWCEENNLDYHFQIMVGGSKWSGWIGFDDDNSAAMFRLMFSDIAQITNTWQVYMAREKINFCLENKIDIEYYDGKSFMGMGTIFFKNKKDFVTLRERFPNDAVISFVDSNERLPNR
jgi:hypothetical protein